MLVYLLLFITTWPGRPQPPALDSNDNTNTNTNICLFVIIIISSSSSIIMSYMILQFNTEGNLTSEKGEVLHMYIYIYTHNNICVSRSLSLSLSLLHIYIYIYMYMCIQTIYIYIRRVGTLRSLLVLTESYACQVTVCAVAA